MSSIVPEILLVLTAALVFASGWRVVPSQNAAAGGVAALLLFLMHPAIFAGLNESSPWDALFVMVFVSAWLWMENWSLFMRSWVLAGLFAFGLWVGSPFVLWGLVAMVPWVLFSRRPLPAVGSLVTVLFGGLFLFGLTWGAAWILIPELGRPLFSQWIRWGGLRVPVGLSLPWCLLVLAAIGERLKEMVQHRRADSTMFMAVLMVVTILLGSPSVSLVLMALAAPLIARALVKREFLFHRGVRWLGSLSFCLTLGLATLFHMDAWMAAGVTLVILGIASRWLFAGARLPWLLAAEALCVGAYAAECVRNFI